MYTIITQIPILFTIMHIYVSLLFPKQYNNDSKDNDDNNKEIVVDVGE